MKDYQQLYQQLKEIYRMDPWEDHDEEQTVAIQLPRQEEPCFVRFLQFEEEQKAILIHRNVQEYILYNDYLDTIFSPLDGLPEHLEKQQGIQIDYLDRDELDEVDYQRIRRSQVKFRGKGVWPEIKVMEPHYLPFEPSGEDLELAENVLREFCSMPPLEFLQTGTEESMPFRYYQPLAGVKHGRWQLTQQHIYDYLTKEESIQGPYRCMLNEFETRRLQKEIRSRSPVTYEIDSFYLPEPIPDPEGQKERFVKLLTVVDKQSGTVLFARLLEQENTFYLHRALYQFFIQARTFPALVELRAQSPTSKPEMYIPFLEKFFIAFKESSRLPATESFRRELQGRGSVHPLM